MTGPASERISPLNSSLSSTTREPFAASASVARPSWIVSRSIATALEVEAELRERPGHTAGGVEPGGELGAFQPGIGNAPFATHQGAEREFDPQGARTHLALSSGRPNSTPCNTMARCRKQAGIHRAGDAEIEPGQAGCSGLELPAIAAPIDVKRPDQRRHQRQDDRNSQNRAASSARRLHSRSSRGPLAPGDVRRPRKRPDHQGVEHACCDRPITAGRACPQPRSRYLFKDAPSGTVRSGGLTANLCPPPMV